MDNYDFLEWEVRVLFSSDGISTLQSHYTARLPHSYMWGSQRHSTVSPGVLGVKHAF